MYIFIVIQKHRLRRTIRHIIYHFYKRRLLVCIGFYWSNLWFFNLNRLGWSTFSFQDDYIIIPQISVGKIHNLLFGNFRKIIHISYLCCPVLFSGKGIHQITSSVAVLFARLDFVFLNIINNGSNKIIIKITFFQILNLIEHQSFHLFQGLSIGWFSIDVQHAMID